MHMKHGSNVETTKRNNPTPWEVGMHCEVDECMYCDKDTRTCMVESDVRIVPTVCNCGKASTDASCELFTNKQGK